MGGASVINNGVSFRGRRLTHVCATPKEQRHMITCRGPNADPNAHQELGPTTARCQCVFLDAVGPASKILFASRAYFIRGGARAQRLQRQFREPWFIILMLSPLAVIRLLYLLETTVFLHWPASSLYPALAYKSASAWRAHSDNPRKKLETFF